MRDSWEETLVPHEPDYYSMERLESYLLNWGPYLSQGRYPRRADTPEGYRGRWRTGAAFEHPAELSADLGTVYRRLTKAQQYVVAHYYGLGYTYEGIARLLGCSGPTVYRTLRDAREEMLAMLNGRPKAPKLCGRVVHEPCKQDNRRTEHRFLCTLSQRHAGDCQSQLHCETLRDHRSASNNLSDSK